MKLVCFLLHKFLFLKRAKLTTMKRILLIIAILLGVVNMNAQHLLLMPYPHGQSLSANHPENVLLKYSSQFTYMETGSFEYEIRGLSFDYSSMTLTLCETRDPTPEEAKVFSANEYPWHNKYEMKITKEQADALFSLFTSAVYSSNYIDSDRIPTTDGCFYQFSVSHYSAATTSPGSKTNCGRLVSVARKVCQSVKSQNPENINTLMNEIKDLTDIFISYYPFDFNKGSIMYHIHKEYKVKGPSVGLKY